ncbi:hypothetical protein [Micromonospora sp. NPDC047740]|uniref:hypothetical protein n=1 Tax=Micromonospora sp. NPDC047740 TaxID=3364254 RepID=UPI003713030E
MTTNRSVHRLDERGTIRDWLVGPAWREPADDLDRHLDAAGSPWGKDGRWVLTNGPDVTTLKQQLYRARPLRRDAPLEPVTEGGQVSYVGPTGIAHQGTWQRVHTAPDGMVDWSAFCFTPEYRLALAATVVEVDQAEWRTLRLASTGPTMLFHDGLLIDESGTVSYMEPVERDIRIWLPSGTSTLVVASWQVAFRECRQVLRLRVGGLPVRVVIPSADADEYVSAAAEQILDAVGVTRWGSTERSVPLTGPDGAQLRISWSTAPEKSTRVRLDGGRAVVPLPEPAPGDEVGSASMLAAAAMSLRIGIDDERAPVQRTFPVAVLPSRYRGEPVGDPADWRREVLQHAADAGNPLAAFTVTGAQVSDKALEVALGMLTNRADCADFEAVGLMHLWHRVPSEGWAAGLRDRVRQALLGFKYWIDQPGLDAMCYFTENHQLVWHTAETLAGEAFPDDTFTNTGWSGAKHAEHGRTLAREWIERRLAGGFSEFDSNAYLAIDTLALVSLAEFSADRELAELAAGLADRVLFSLAANTWRGIHGAAHGRSYVQTLRSSRLEETAPITWLCFGVGALNDAVLPVTVLATARRYALPDAIRAVARHRADDWLGRQSYRGTYRFAHDLLERPYGSDALIYRTPDVMLASVQDYRVGLPGLQEHIWGATLGPETQIFVTHPPNASSSPSSRPNAWAGNRILPRVRQFRDTVLALYSFPDGDPTSRTHAWFPIAHLDEWARHGVWIAGRLGDGYVALATDGGAAPVESGPDAWQELLPAGDGTAWVCVVGRRATDGSFQQFLASLATPQFDTGRVRFTPPRGPALDLAWTGPFTVAGRPADLDADDQPEAWPQIDNPACLLHHGEEEMVIAIDGTEHRIDLRRGRPLP